MHEEESGFKSLDYKQLTSPMIAAIQALYAENKELKEKLSVLEDRLGKLEK